MDNLAPMFVSPRNRRWSSTVGWFALPLISGVPVFRVIHSRFKRAMKGRRNSSIVDIIR